MLLSSVDTNYNGRVNTTCEEGFVFNMTGVLLSERPAYWESKCSGSGKWDPPLLACIGEKNAEMIMTQIIPDIFLQHLAALKSLRIEQSNTTAIFMVPNCNCTQTFLGGMNWDS